MALKICGCSLGGGTLVNSGRKSGPSDISGGGIFDGGGVAVPSSDHGCGDGCDDGVDENGMAGGAKATISGNDFAAAESFVTCAGNISKIGGGAAEVSCDSGGSDGSMARGHCISVRDISGSGVAEMSGDDVCINGVVSKQAGSNCIDFSESNGGLNCGNNDKVEMSGNVDGGTTAVGSGGKRGRIGGSKVETSGGIGKGKIVPKLAGGRSELNSGAGTFERSGNEAGTTESSVNSPGNDGIMAETSCSGACSIFGGGLGGSACETSSGFGGNRIATSGTLVINGERHGGAGSTICGGSACGGGSNLSSVLDGTASMSFTGKGRRSSNGGPIV